MNRFISYILITICVIFFIAVGFWTYRMFIFHPSVTEVKIAYVAPKDSLNGMEVIKLNNETTDSLIRVLETQEEQLNARYELFLKAREDDADVTRMLSCFGAFLLAILGVFGIKSYKDFTDRIEEKAKAVAKSKAEEIAQDEATTTAQRIAEKKAESVAGTAAINAVQHLIESTVARKTDERLSNGTYTEEIVQKVLDSVLPIVQNFTSDTQTEGDTNESATQNDVAEISSLPPIDNHEPSDAE